MISQSDLKSEVDHAQLSAFYGRFREDFIDNPFTVQGKEILVDHRVPKDKEYERYCATFYHLITRKFNIKGVRLYECERANRIHWIRPILLARPGNKILYYKWKDSGGICKTHFWYRDKKFMVVLKDLGDNSQIVTAFCVDPDKEEKYFERFVAYRDR